MSVDQQLNIACEELKTAPASAYDTLRECLHFDKSCASRVVEVIDGHVGKREPETKWVALRAQACFLAGRVEEAGETAFDAVRQALRANVEPPADMMEVLEWVARERGASVLSMLCGQQCHAETGDPIRDVLTAVYMRGILREQVPTGVRALRRKAEIEVRGIRHGRATVPTEYERYIRFLKHFSSFTPVMRNKDIRRLGGGYLLKLGNYNLVVDPGHHFVDNFFRENFRIGEINGILVTHFHDDHYADLPALISLVFRHSRNHDARGIDLFTDETTAKMFAPLLASAPPIRRHVLLVPLEGGEVEIDTDLHLKVIPTFHEIFGEGNTGVGFCLTLGPPDRASGILVTGDTGWDDRLVSAYSAARSGTKSLVLIVHISSVYAEEIPNPFAAVPDVHAYPKHLCVYGMCRAIEACKPDVIVLSEIGEELAVALDDICTIVESVYGIPCVIGQLGRSGDYLPLGQIEYGEWKRRRVHRP